MISFERTLINIKNIPDVSLYSNVICIINREADPEKINIPQLVEYLREINIPSQDNYNEVIQTMRSVIFSNQARMCRFLGGIEQKEFNTDNFILLSYLNFENKNYINGFIKVKNCPMYRNIIKTNYICTDLYFNGIGKALLTLLKSVVIHLNIPKIRIQSINRPTTLNFYTTQNLYPIAEQPNPKYTWMEWDYRSKTLKDDGYLESMKFPFHIILDKEKYMKNRKDVDDAPILPFRQKERKSTSSRSSSSRRSNSVFHSVESI
jgi:hypothetical protein